MDAARKPSDRQLHRVAGTLDVEKGNAWVLAISSPDVMFHQERVQPLLPSEELVTRVAWARLEEMRQAEATALDWSISMVLSIIRPSDAEGRGEKTEIAFFVKKSAGGPSFEPIGDMRS